MPLGLNRSGDFANGFPITLPHDFGNPVTVAANEFESEPQPAPIGTGNIVTLPIVFGNAVTLPKNFGNLIPWQPPTPPYSGFELEDDSGVILLEDGDVLLLENQ